MEVDPALIWFGSVIISAAVSGIFGFYFESIRDRRLAEHADRKEHFQKIRVEVLEKMIDQLGRYRSSIDQNVGGWEVPRMLERSEPTSSKLFQTLQSHFPVVKSEWDKFERKMESFGAESTAFYLFIENLLAKQHDESFQRLVKLSDRNLAPYICTDFYGRLVDPRREKDPADAITIKPHGEDWLIDHPRGNFFVRADDRESLEAVKDIRHSIRSLADSENVRKQATEIAHNRILLVENRKKLETLIREAIAVSKLEGKCKYCP